MYETFPDSDLLGIGKIVFGVFEWVDMYKQSILNNKISVSTSGQQQKSTGGNDKIDLAILLFFERVMTECMLNIKGKDPESPFSYSGQQSHYPE